MRWLTVKRVLIVAVVALPLGCIAYLAYRFAMHHIGYRGTGCVDDVASLPYGFGEVFHGLEAQGEVHYAYKTGPRGVRCLFTGSASQEHVARFCRQQEGCEGLRASDADCAYEVRRLKADPSIFLGDEGDEVLSAAWDTKYGNLSIIYRQQDKRFVAHGIVVWSALRRQRWAD